MEHRKKGSILSGVFSFLYLLAAIRLLLGVCGYCYPEAGERVRVAISGIEDNPVRAAFNVLSDDLENGKSIKDAALASLDVIIGNAD